MEFDPRTLVPAAGLWALLFMLVKLVDFLVRRTRGNGLAPVLQNDLEHVKLEFNRLRDAHTKLERDVGMIRTDVRVLLDRGGEHTGKD